MLDKPFHASKLKINRAERHISDLKTLLTDFIAKIPYTIICKPDLSSTSKSVQVEQTEPFPDDTPLILGDAIHNLRTSLDLLACDLVRLNNGNVKDVYFPFANSAANLEQAIKNRNINRAKPDIVKIIRSLKPYYGGNDILRAIHDLDINDKHKLIIPLIELAELKDVTIRLPHNNTIHIGTIVTQHGDKGPKLVSFSSDWEAQIEHYGGATVHINFGKGQPFEGQEILSSLNQMMSTVQSVIQVFESHCFR